MRKVRIGIQTDISNRNGQSTKTTLLSRWKFRVSTGVVLVLLTSLTACKNRDLASDLSSVKLPATTEVKMVDFRTTPCEAIWYYQDQDTLENSLYWLRAIDCAGSLTRETAREKAQEWIVVSWHSALKRGILVADGEPSLSERRKLIGDINQYRMDIPSSLRPLLQIWREQQILKLNLLEDRKRYQQLVTSTDSKIDALKVHESQLRHQLEETIRKLSSLSDIERQLSTRKRLQNELPQEQNSQSGTVPAAELKPVEKSAETAVKPNASASDGEKAEQAETSPQQVTKPTQPDVSAPAPSH